MKIFLTKILAIAMAIALSSCQPMSNQNATGAGAVTGALGGAAMGAVVGNQSGRAGEGALFGAGAGALIGARDGKRWFGGDGSIQKVEAE